MWSDCNDENHLALVSIFDAHVTPHRQRLRVDETKVLSSSNPLSVVQSRNRYRSKLRGIPIESTDARSLEQRWGYTGTASKFSKHRRGGRFESTSNHSPGNGGNW
jgi:hypothetical protein